MVVYCLSLKNDDSTTIEKPPNHCLFNSMIPVFSPVLQHCLDAQNTKPVATSSAPIFNISVGDAVLNLFHPQLAIPEPLTPQLAAVPLNQNKMLLNPACDLGHDMSIAEFCEFFGLQHTVLQKLKKNAYDFAHNLCFIALGNSAQMGFKLGENAALQDPVERWSLPCIM